MDKSKELPQAAIPLLNEYQAAAFLSVSVATIRRWRRNGQGCPHVKLGTAVKAPVRYRLADLEAFIASGLRP